LCYLRIIFLSNNFFSHSLNGIFNSTCQIYLRNIDISANFITGSITNDIYNLKSLQTFSAVENCMSSQIISNNICNSNTLMSLVLDGLQTASKCQNRIFPNFKFFPSTYYLANNIIKGGINNCLFNISTLKTLHLSGNGITGSVSNTIVISSSSSDLSLSNNKLINSIPNHIQAKKFYNLDLSFNKLDGFLSSEIPYNINTSIKLNNNRLSGDIPKSIINVKDIEVLNGNIFECSFFNRITTLPKYDNANDIYSCGSNNFNLSICILFFILLLVLLFKFKIWKILIVKKENKNMNNNEDNDSSIGLFDLLFNFINKKIFILKLVGKITNTMKFETISLIFKLIKEENSINIYSNSINEIPTSNEILELCNISYLLWKSLKICSILLMIFCIPFSFIISQYYKTYSISYSWVVSSIFLSGVGPSLLLMLLFFIFINMFYYIYYIIIMKNDMNKNIFSSKYYDEKKENRLLPSAFIVIINFMIMFILNGSYVYVTLAFNGETVIIIEIFVALCKTIWKDILLPSLILHIRRYFDKDYFDSIGRNFRNDINLQCSLGILNNLIIPFVATAMINPTCFYNALVPQESIISTYSYEICADLNNVNNYCQDYAIDYRSTTYNPPFTYSYQCSSSLAVYYGPIYVYMCIFLCLGQPLVAYILKYLYLFAKDSVFYNILEYIIPQNLKPVYNNSINSNERILSNNNDYSNRERISAVEVNSKDVKYEKSNHILFNQRAFIVNIVNFFSILSTIGIVLPFVGITCCICLSIYIHNTLTIIGGKITLPNNESQFNNIIGIFNRDCEGIYKSIIVCLTMIFPVMGCFYSIFVFDTLGDVVGAKIAVWYLLVMILFPFILKYLWLYNVNNVNIRDSNINLFDSFRMSNMNKRDSLLEMGYIIDNPIQK
jgi:hypothetical protein